MTLVVQMSPWPWPGLQERNFSFPGSTFGFPVIAVSICGSTASKRDPRCIGTVSTFSWHRHPFCREDPWENWFPFKEYEMVWRQCLNVVGVLWQFCDRTIVEHCFSLTVWNLWSSNVCLRSTEHKIFLIIRSQAPPWCDPAGGLKLHVIPFSDKAL